MGSRRSFRTFPRAREPEEADKSHETAVSTAQTTKQKAGGRWRLPLFQSLLPLDRSELAANLAAAYRWRQSTFRRRWVIREQRIVTRPFPPIFPKPDHEISSALKYKPAYGGRPMLGREVPLLADALLEEKCHRSDSTAKTATNAPKGTGC
jgi:hypothetical protein